MIAIFYANPNKTGNCAMLLAEVEKDLLTRQIPYEVFDLFDEKFDPVLGREEQYTVLGAKARDDAKKYQEIIKKYDKFIFIYPIWWNSMPAQLKGFFDRVFTSKFAFQYVKYKFIPFAIPIGLLKGKKALALTTTGSAWWQAGLFLWFGYGKQFTLDIMLLCGVRAKMLSLHNCDYKVDLRRKQGEKITKRGLKWLLR
jgi:NAD(P)H dehydrogenase (quinone)